MKLYAGIDLHANNSVVVVSDEEDRILYQKRWRNELGELLGAFAPYHDTLQGIVVESTYNWYWLVDGLMAAGYRVHLANPTAIEQDKGLKHTDDESDARWLAHVLRLGIWPEGDIYPKEERAVRDLLRKRSQLVRQRTSNLLSIQNLVTRNTGSALSGTRSKRLTVTEVEELLPRAELALAVKSNLAVLQCVAEQIESIEEVVLAQLKLREGLAPLLTVSGIGQILGMTIMLETGEISRFATVGDFASYCRCVGSQKLSNGKRKGQGNTKNGNKYLAWAFVEAAHFAIRYNAQIKRFYQRKQAKTNGIVAVKAVAHKLARACYYILRDQVPFEVTKAFT
jgi:transposase